MSREGQNTYSDLMSGQNVITRLGRAQIIDALFQAAQYMKIEDKSIVYQSVSLFDRFYSKNKEIVFTFKDGLLTGFTSLFIASKS